MPECRGAPKESKPARLNSRPITASCAKVPPAPPYSSGIAGQRSPAAPALFQTSRPYLPSSFHVSRCGTYSAAIKRRACSSSSTRSSVIQLGRGRLRTFMSNPVDRTAYRAPLHYARATSVGHTRVAGSYRSVYPNGKNCLEGSGPRSYSLSANEHRLHESHPTPAPPIEHADAGMTSSVPWQIRGVSLQTREAAREAARRSGISVGEWLDRALLDLALQDGVDPRPGLQSLSDSHDDGGDETTQPSCDLGWAVKPLCDHLAKISPMLREAVLRRVVKALASEVRKLADRVEYTRHAGGDGTGLASVVRGLAETREPLRAATPTESLLGRARAGQQLAQRAARRVERLGPCAARLNHLEAIERGLAELLVHLARQRVPTLARVAAPPPELDALSHDVAELRQAEK